MKSPTAKQIRHFRAEYGLSQIALAKMAHVTDRTVQRWEADTPGAGKAMPPAAWELVNLKVGAMPLEPIAVEQAAPAAPAAPPPAPTPAPPAPDLPAQPPAIDAESRRAALRELAQRSNSLKPRM